METKVQFHKNMAVLTANGQEVGSLDRVVFSPEIEDGHPYCSPHRQSFK